MATHPSTSLFVVVLLAVVANAEKISELASPGGLTYSIISNEKLSWFDATSFCQARGWEIASLTVVEEFDYVDAQLIGRGIRNEMVWVGGTEIGFEDNYYWVTTGASVDLNKWDPTEVVNVAHKCLVMNKGFWRHNDCSAKGYFVCLQPAEVPPTP
ncbi:snaclec 1-like [Cloeon dipterum]|uniref:snaclec 1-like n=1 Tax=Cloeon dipterum TaxID=197152 RepID=UPI00321F8B8D